jgi:hypothetical protein
MSNVGLDRYSPGEASRLIPKTHIYVHSTSETKARESERKRIPLTVGMCERLGAAEPARSVEAYVEVEKLSCQLSVYVIRTQRTLSGDIIHKITSQSEVL